MKLYQGLLIFVIFINFSYSNPLKPSLIKNDLLNSQNFISNRRPHAESKNWKIESEYYNEKSPSNNLFDDPPTTYRLPNDTLPVRYDIHLETAVHEPNFNFLGRVRIHIRAVEETSVVTLQYRRITINKVSLIGTSNDEVLEDQLTFDYIPTHEFLKIQLPRTLQVAEEIRLDITYNGTLSESNDGFYRAYYEENGERVYYAVTQFESTDARHAFPCYDEPGIRAPIGLEIQHHKDYTAEANMPLIERIPVQGTDNVLSKFSDTPSMQTYLLAFLVSPFESASNNEVDIPQRILAKPSSIASGSADFAVSVVDPIIKELINLFGVNYTLPKLDHAAITQFAAGAMENWGLVTYREIYLLFTPSNDPSRDESRKRNIIATIAHEDAHQFFGNLVAPHWWSDLWLNEGFATLYEYYIPHLLYPDDGWMEEFRVYELNWCFGYDIGGRQPMHYYVETPTAIDGRFNSVSYTKSGVVLNMFQEALGVSTFTKGLNKYLNKMAYKTAVPDDLFASLQEAFNEDYSANIIDISQAMGTWVYQAGYPLVEVSRAADGTITFKQRRYPTSNGEIYSIPISYSTSKGLYFEDTRASMWQTQANTSFHQSILGMSDGDWIILNNQQTGYYRVAYSSELWQAIGKGLQKDYSQVHITNRRVLQTELYLGYSTLGNVWASDVLEVLSYLINETEYLVWSDAENSLKALNATLFGTTAYGSYLNFVRTISRKQLERVGFEAIDGESASTTNLRNQVKIYNCYALDENCLNHELNKLRLYKEGNDDMLPDFCSAFRLAPSDLYTHYINQLATNRDLAYRTRIVNSIGCSLNEELLREVIKIIEVSENVLTDFERDSIINTMMTSSTHGFKVALEFVDKNVNKISSFTPYLRIVINTRDDYDKASEILSRAVDGSFISAEAAQSVLNDITKNLEWQDKHLDLVLEWFDADVEETTTPQVTTPTQGSSSSSQAPTTTPSTTSTTDSGIEITASFVVICLSMLSQIVMN